MSSYQSRVKQSRSTKWSEHDIPDQAGKIIIITGASSGLGLASAALLAARNATVVMACRPGDKAAKALASVQAVASPDASVLLGNLELSDLASVRAFVEWLPFDHVDVLLNNAGIAFTAFTRSKDGFELQMGVNHLAHFALTGLLLPKLRAAPNGARVVGVSSAIAGRAKGDFIKDFNYEKTTYSKVNAYAHSKLANLLFAHEFNRRVPADDNVIAVTAHPGGSKSNMQSRIKDSSAGLGFVLALASVFFQSTEQGALAQVRAAVDPAVQANDYYGPKGAMGGLPVLVAEPKLASDAALGQSVWQESTQLTGVAYPGFP